jgi:hypothetical protein
MPVMVVLYFWLCLLDHLFLRTLFADDIDLAQTRGRAAITGLFEIQDKFSRPAWNPN